MNVSGDLAFTERQTGNYSMMIEEMGRDACIGFLDRIHLGRLACEQSGQPYVTPFYFACHRDALYGFSTVGQKVTWSRANPRVCVEADEVTIPQQWISGIAFGRYEELPAGPDHDAERRLVHRIVRQRSLWWEPGYAKTVVHGNERHLDLV